MTTDPRFGDARIRPAPFLIIVGGSVGLIVGVLAVVAWWTPAALPVQFRANVAFNEALAIAATGAATLMLALGRPAVARVLGAGIVVGALLTLLQSVWGTSFGIDDLLWQAPDTDMRMAPSSAFVLLLAGLCVALPSQLVSARVVVSLGVLAGASIALTGALAGISQAAAWGATRSMSRIAACALLAVGVALATHAFTRAQGERGQRRRWAPLTAGLASAAAGVLFWQALVAHQDANMRRTVATEVVSQRARATERFSRLAGTLQGVGYAAYSQTTSIEAWRTQARTVVTLFPSLLALEWIAPDLSVRRIAVDAPSSPAPPSPPSAPLADAEQRALEAARRSSQATISGRLQLPDGRWAMRVAVPIFPRGRFAGFVAGLVLVEELLTEEPGDTAPDFTMMLSANGDEVFRSAATGTVGDGGMAWAQSRRIPLPGDIVWAVGVAPAPRLEAAINTALPEIVLAAGLLIALALAVALRLAIKLERRARLLSHTNRRLGLEVEQRRQAELKLQDMAHALEGRVAERTRELAAANSNLERSNEDLRQFGAFVAHELRQPIATAQIWADVLEQRAGDSLAESAQASLGKLRTAIERMKGLVDKELRLAADATEVASIERVNLRSLVTEVVGDLRPRIEKAGARVELGALPVVSADPSLLRRLFTNLLENALKHPRPDAPLVVRVDSSTLAAENGLGPRHEIRVVDNGRGFPADEATRIFEIFARVRGNSEVEGSGLGLAICRRIAERHAGSIRAEGRPGEGATFFVTLPAKVNAEA